MFKNLNKLEKAGLVIGSLEALVGLGMYVYGSYQYKKLSNQIKNDVQDINNRTEELIHEAGFVGDLED